MGLHHVLESHGSNARDAFEETFDLVDLRNAFDSLTRHPKVVGWGRYGAKPGATKGTAILAGHINYAGVDGAMSQIGQLRPGEHVYVYGTQNADRKKETAEEDKVSPRIRLEKLRQTLKPFTQQQQ